MPVIAELDFQDPRLSAFSHQRDAVLASSKAGEPGLFVGESLKIISRALDAGVKMRGLLIDRDTDMAHSQALFDRVTTDHPEVPVYLVDHPTFEKLTDIHVVHAPMAVFERPALPDPRELLKGATRVAVLEDIVNSTNIGAAFRSAAALEVDAVLVTPSCHDPLYRRAARVSVGTVFQVPWTRIGTTADWASEGVSLLHECGFQVAALALRDDAVSLADQRLAQIDKLALVLGTEGDGLRSTTIEEADWKVRIPMREGVDSLNVAAASAVAFWELVCRPRSL